MYKETTLKKEFKEKDIQRLRNIVAKKYGDKTVTQVGFNNQVQEYVEGDVWEENNKTWTIKNGIKQTLTKLDGIKSLLKIPMCCPDCNKAMRHKLDKKMYTIHKKCSDCVASMESMHKINGTYETYKKDFIKANILTDINEAKTFIDEFLNSDKDKFVTEDGDIEEMDGDIDKKKLSEQWNLELEEMKEFLNK